MSSTRAQSVKTTATEPWAQPVSAFPSLVHLAPPIVHREDSPNDAIDPLSSDNDARAEDGLRNNARGECQRRNHQRYLTARDHSDANYQALTCRQAAHARAKSTADDFGEDRDNGRQHDKSKRGEQRFEVCVHAG